MGVKCEICNVNILFPKGTSLAQNTDNTPTEMCRLVRLGETKARKRQGKNIAATGYSPRPPILSD